MSIIVGKDVEFIVTITGEINEVISILSRDGQKYYASLYCWLKKQNKVLLNHYRSEIGKRNRIMSVPLPLRFWNKVKCSDKWWKKIFFCYELNGSFMRVEIT